MEINYYIEPDVPLMLNGDSSRIRQIINNLERMDENTASKQIRALNKSVQPYIIALTVGVQKEDSDKAFEAGMNAFATKPLQLEDRKTALADAGC